MNYPKTCILGELPALYWSRLFFNERVILPSEPYPCYNQLDVLDDRYKDIYNECIDLHMENIFNKK